MLWIKWGQKNLLWLFCLVTGIYYELPPVWWMMGAAVWLAPIRVTFDPTNPKKRKHP